MLRFGLAFAICVISVLSGLGGLRAQEAPVPDAPEVLWHHEGGRYARRPPPVHRGMVYVGGPRLVALNPRTGTVLHAAPDDGPWGEPEVYGDVVVANRRGKGTYAFHFTLDRELWSVEDGVSRRVGGAVCGDAYVMTSAEGLSAWGLADGMERWRAAIDADITAGLAADEERVFLTLDSGEVVAVSAQDGAEVWRFDTGSKFSGVEPLIHDGVVFVADRGRGDGIITADRGKRVGDVDGQRGGAIHALDAATGEHLWGRIFGATGCSPLHVHGNFLWAGFGRSVARFDLRDTGAMDTAHAIRTGTNAFGSPTVLGEQIVFGNLDGHLYVHDIDTGILAWKFDAGEYERRDGDRRRAQVGAFTCADGRVFVSTSRGLYAIGDRAGDPVPNAFVLRPKE